MSDEGITSDDRSELIGAMLALHGELQAEIEKDSLDPARLMRLQGAALNQCLIALCHLLDPKTDGSGKC